MAERALFSKMKDCLEAERPLREVELSDDERRRARNYSFLSEKPVLLVVNLGEERVRGAAEYLASSGLAEFAKRPGFALCPVSAPIEAEMADLSPEDAQAFRQDLGLQEPGLDRVIQTSYALLGLISFLTAGEDECRAWTIRRGTKAPVAAGAIHSDIERGFIRAEVVSYPDLVAAGSLAACRDKGTLAPRGQGIRGAGRRRDQLPLQRLASPWRAARPAGGPWRWRGPCVSIAERRCPRRWWPRRPRALRSSRPRPPLRPRRGPGPEPSWSSTSRQGTRRRSATRWGSCPTRRPCAIGAAAMPSRASSIRPRPRRKRPGCARRVSPSSSFPSPWRGRSPWWRTPGAREREGLRLRGASGPWEIAASHLLLVVRGPIVREYQAPLEQRRIRTARLEDGYRFHLHLRSSPLPLELDPGDFDFGAQAPLSGSSILELSAWIESVAQGTPVDDAFRHSTPALGPTTARPSGPTAAAAALSGTDPGSATTGRERSTTTSGSSASTRPGEERWSAPEWSSHERTRARPRPPGSPRPPTGGRSRPRVDPGPAPRARRRRRPALPDARRGLAGLSRRARSRRGIRGSSRGRRFSRPTDRGPSIPSCWLLGACPSSPRSRCWCSRRFPSPALSSTSTCVAWERVAREPTRRGSCSGSVPCSSAGWGTPPPWSRPPRWCSSSWPWSGKGRGPTPRAMSRWRGPWPSSSTRDRPRSRARPPFSSSLAFCCPATDSSARLHALLALGCGFLLAAPQLVPTALALREAGAGTTGLAEPAAALPGLAGLLVRYVSHTPAPALALAALPLLVAAFGAGLRPRPGRGSSGRAGLARSRRSGGGRRPRPGLRRPRRARDLRAHGRSGRAARPASPGLRPRGRARLRRRALRRDHPHRAFAPAARGGGGRAGRRLHRVPGVRELPKLREGPRLPAPPHGIPAASTPWARGLQGSAHEERSLRGNTHPPGARPGDASAERGARALARVGLAHRRRSRPRLCRPRLLEREAERQRLRSARLRAAPHAPSTA